MTTHASVPTSQPGTSYRNQQLIGRIASYTVLVLFALLFLLPVAWMLSTSLKPKAEWFARDIAWIPQTITLQNYTTLFNKEDDKKKIKK